MNEYINKKGLIEALNKFAPEHYNALINQLITKYPASDVVEAKYGENIGKVHPVDEFVCSGCGIFLEGWTRVVTDEDGDLFYYEYEFKYCPECGAKIDGGETH